MKQKECKYTKMGQIDDCPFGNKCFYRHQMTDGSIVDGESPRELRKRRKIIDSIQRDILNSDDENMVMNDVIEQVVSNINNRS